MFAASVWFSRFVTSVLCVVFVVCCLLLFMFSVVCCLLFCLVFGVLGLGSSFLFRVWWFVDCVLCFWFWVACFVL